MDRLEGRAESRPMGSLRRLAGLARAPYFALAVALIASPPASALDPEKPFHQFVRDSWSVESGLPQLSATAIAQTPDGYLWVGTQRGLARFDGVRFTVYKPRDTPALPSVYIQELFVDSEGRLWIGTAAGVAQRKPDGSFAPVRMFDTSGKRAVTPRVYDFAEPERGAVVAASTAGLLTLRADGSMQVDARTPRASYAVLVDGGETLLGMDGGVLRLSAKAPPVWLALPATAGLSPVTELAAHAKVVWVGTATGLHVIEKGQLIPVPLPEPAARAAVDMLHEDASGILWAGTRAGLLRFSDRQLKEILDEAPLRFVEAGFEDHEGNLWLGSRSSGLHRLWNGWGERYSSAEGLNNAVVWSVTSRRSGGFWVGTSGGIQVFDGRRFLSIPGLEGLRGRSVYAVLEEDDGTLFATSLGVLQHRAGRVSPLPGGESFASQRVYGIERDERGDLVVATEVGAFRGRDGHFTPVLSEPLEAAYGMRSLTRAADGTLVAAAQGGVFTVAEQLRPLSLEDMSRDFQGMTTDPAGNLLAGDGTGNVWVQRAGRMLRFGAEHGLPENFPTSLTVDRQGVLWVGGLLGLYRVPLADFDAVLEGRLSRLRAQMVLSITGRVPGAQRSFCCNGGGDQAALLAGDDLWMTSPDGLVRVPTATLAANQAVPAVHVERLHHSGAWHSATASGTPTLPLGARDLQFDFTVNSFRDPKSARLEFQLEGYDQGWRALEDATYRRATYTNLPPGTYAFRVRGANDSGAWNEQEAVQRFVVPAYWHETLWLWVLVGLTVMGGAFLVYRWRLARLEFYRSRLEAIVAQRTQELGDANRQLVEASETDALTRLKNRRYLYEQLPSDIATLQRRLRSPEGARQALGFLVVDVDYFKKINDTYGHHTGDEVLRHMAVVLREAVRTGDYVVRWGGEEFLVVLRDISTGEVERIAESIRARVAGAEFLDESGLPFEVTASVGGIEYPLVRAAPQALSWQKHVELADLALYDAKRAGRNTWAMKRPTAEAASLLNTRLANGPTPDLVTAGIAVTALRT